MLQTRSLIFGLVAAFLMTAPADAQALRKPAGWGAVVILEPLVLAHGGLAAPCNPRAAARADWGIDRIERLLQLADHQQRLLNDLKVAVMKASDLRAGTCPVPVPTSSAERISFMQQRLESLRQAIEAVVPQFQAFYLSLGAEQRTQLDAGPRRWRWR
jgi:hypothetical protein